MTQMVLLGTPWWVILADDRGSSYVGARFFAVNKLHQIWLRVVDPKETSSFIVSM